MTIKVNVHQITQLYFREDCEDRHDRYKFKYFTINVTTIIILLTTILLREVVLSVLFSYVSFLIRKSPSGINIAVGCTKVECCILKSE